LVGFRRPRWLRPLAAYERPHRSAVSVRLSRSAAGNPSGLSLASGRGRPAAGGPALSALSRSAAGGRRCLPEPWERAAAEPDRRPGLSPRQGLQTLTRRGFPRAWRDRGGRLVRNARAGRRRSMATRSRHPSCVLDNRLPKALANRDVTLDQAATRAPTALLTVGQTRPKGGQRAVDRFVDGMPIRRSTRLQPCFSLIP
jgi:hypothetical protein